MTSLADVYEREVGEYADPRQLYFGIGLFCLGAVLSVVGVVVAASQPTTNALGLGTAREYGAIIAGVGVPAVFLGIFTVLPAGRITRAAAVVGSGIAVLGISLFSYAYPCRWSGAVCPNVSGNLTLAVAAVYSLGVLTTFWCLFVGVANFKSRNDPGGTVELEITRGGETRVIEVPESELEDTGTGGVGFFGDTPDGDVATQTNRPDVPADVDDATIVGNDSGTGSRAGRSGGLDDGGSHAGRSGGLNDGASHAGRSSGLDDVSTASDGTGSTTRSTGTDTSGGLGGVARRAADDAPHVSDGGPGGTQPAQPADDDPSLDDVDDVSGGTDSRGVTSETTAGSARSARPPGGRNTDNEINEVEPSEMATSPGDSYCGSCAHFQYVRTDDGMQPYCAYHDEVMDDMDACTEWTSR